jgi:hypothetical protein
MVNPSSYQCVDVAPAKFTFATIDRFIKAFANCSASGIVVPDDLGGDSERKAHARRH